MNAQTQTPMFEGQAVLFDTNGSRAGWIAKIDRQKSAVYTLGAGGLEREFYRVWIVWDDMTTSEVSEGIARPWIDRAAVCNMVAKSADDVAELFKAAEAAEAERRAEAQRKAQEQRQAVSDWRDSIRDKIPADAKAVLIAELVEDESDSMTDYFGHSVKKTVILGFSRHTRDLFPEMRKAAARYEATEHLTDAPADAEHREKYSMGGGYYLKQGFRHSTGWKVVKRPFYSQGNDPAENIPFGEWAVPSDSPFVTGNNPRKEPADAPADAETVGGFLISEHTHSKRGFQMWIVSPVQRVGRETFSAWLEKAKARKGWYSRKWGSSPAGFAFKSAEAANEFAQELAQ